MTLDTRLGTGLGTRARKRQAGEIGAGPTAALRPASDGTAPAPLRS